ncbi:MAG TPA: phosphate ABC transporter permease PstA [Acidimicrobiales bacterium]|nr:phosphate ABC transporter permease PstA [Acidimicrobiales bacterium]
MSATTSPPPQASSSSRPTPAGHSGRRVRVRKVRNRMRWGLCTFALALLVVPLVSIMWGIAGHALAHWHWSYLTTYPSGNGGGLLNSIEGSLLIVALVLVVAGTIGIGGGVYLAEYVSEDRGQLLRRASEVLAGIPSIVFGYVGFVALNVKFHWGNSLYAGIIVLSVLVVPYITKTTEVALRNVPTTYREGAEALGMRGGYALRKFVLRPALPGIATGLIIAVAIAVGETAPLLFTLGYNSKSPTFALHNSPAGYLTYNVFTDYNQPFASSHDRAFAAAFLLIVLVLVLIVIARVVVMTTQRHSPDRPQRMGRAPK